MTVEIVFPRNPGKIGDSVSLTHLKFCRYRLRARNTKHAIARAYETGLLP